MAFSKTLANLGRLREITGVLARHGFDHFLEMRRDKKSTGKVPAEITQEVSSTAHRFKDLLEDLGPTFIKFGQILSTRNDLLPRGFPEALSELQDKVEPIPIDEIKSSIEKGLGDTVENLFQEFDEEPLASASIAQVHRALTKDGEHVAVKVQRASIANSIINDLDLLRGLAHLLEAIVAETGLVTPKDVVDEFEQALLGELDFTREARHLKRFYDNTQGKERTYIVPKVYDELSSKTVLTMDLIVGTRLADLGPDSHDPKEIARNIVIAAFEQLFVDGLFHADPHPGNSLILDDNRFGLLDFGAVGQISPAMRDNLVMLVVAVGTRDADTVARLLYRVGVPDVRISLRELRDDCAKLLTDYFNQDAYKDEVAGAQLLNELFDLAARYKIRIPGEYVMCGRCAVVVEGVIRSLDPDLEVLALGQPFVKQLLDERLSIPDLGESTFKNLFRASGFVKEIPITVSQVLTDLETGKLAIQVNNPNFERIVRTVDALGVTIFMGLVACGLIGGSLVILGNYDIEILGVPVLPAVSLYLASMLFGGTLGRYWLSPHIKKISLGRFFGRQNDMDE